MVCSCDTTMVLLEGELKNGGIVHVCPKCDTQGEEEGTKTIIDISKETHGS